MNTHEWQGRITYEHLPQIYEKLMEDLPLEAIQHVDGTDSKKGYDATGYSYQYVVNRLNEVIPGHWDYIEEMDPPEVIHYSKDYKPIRRVCRLTLMIGNWHFINGENKFEILARATNYGVHEARNDGDARKGALGNAFKKTAAMLGIGKKAFEGKLDEDYFSLQAQEEGKPAEAQKKHNQHRKKAKSQQKKQSHQQPPQDERKQYLDNFLQAASGEPTPEDIERQRFRALAEKVALKPEEQRALSFYLTGKASGSALTAQDLRTIRYTLEIAIEYRQNAQTDEERMRALIPIFKWIAKGRQNETRMKDLEREKERKRFFALTGGQRLALTVGDQRALCYSYTDKESRSALTAEEFLQINQVLEIIVEHWQAARNEEERKRALLPIMRRIKRVKKQDWAG